MKGMKNAVHFGILGIWAVLGVMLSLKLLFGAFEALAIFSTSQVSW